MTGVAKAVLVFGAIAAVTMGAGRSKAIAAGIEPNDLIGTWEAVSPGSMRIFIADLRETMVDSYVAMVSESVFLFRVHSWRVKGHHVEVHGEGLGEALNLTLKITGDGWAGGGRGELKATIVIADMDGKRVYSRFKTRLINYGGRFVEEFVKMKRKAEDAIIAAKKASQVGGPTESPAGARSDATK